MKPLLLASYLVLPALLTAGPIALAEDTDAAPGAGGFLQSPTVSPSPVTGDIAEPDITIREEGDQMIYEYRVKGQLYMIKIQPQFGPPYYLLDTNGDGTLDTRDTSPTDINIPQWLLFTWD